MADRDRVSKLSEWAKTPTPKTHWKSGQELADELEQKRAQRAEKKVQSKDGDGKNRRIDLKVAAGLSLAVMGIGIAIVGTQSAPVDRSAEIQALTTQVAQAQQASEVVPDVEGAKVAVNALQENSQKVADLQNQYRGWSTTTSDADAKRVADLHAQLSELVPDKAAVRWYAPLAKGASGQTSALPADQYEWESVVTYGVTDTSALPIAWLCKGADGTLLAWTTATYDATSGTFSGVRTGVTSAGARLLVSDDTAHENGVG